MYPIASPILWKCTKGRVVTLRMQTRSIRAARSVHYWINAPQKRRSGCITCGIDSMRRQQCVQAQGIQAIRYAINNSSMFAMPHSSS